MKYNRPRIYVDKEKLTEEYIEDCYYVPQFDFAFYAILYSI